jgi:hypothetical protein
MNSTYFNTGLYTIPEASRLTGVSRGRIRRWLRGYRYRSRNKSYTSLPLWHGQWELKQKTFNTHPSFALSTSLYTDAIF